MLRLFSEKMLYELPASTGGPTAMTPEETALLLFIVFIVVFGITGWYMAYNQEQH